MILPLKVLRGEAFFNRVCEVYFYDVLWCGGLLGVYFYACAVGSGVLAFCFYDTLFYL